MFSEFPVRAQQWRDFASAHSCGLRLDPRALTYNTRFLCHSAFVRVATMKEAKMIRDWLLCHSAFVRVATMQCALLQNAELFATAHSCGLRPREIHSAAIFQHLCHSAFVRVATRPAAGSLRLSCSLPQRIRAGCDCTVCAAFWLMGYFATAHSCGLRPLRICLRES